MAYNNVRFLHFNLMDGVEHIERVLSQYNPWWPSVKGPDPEAKQLPNYRREVFDEIYSALMRRSFSLSIIGPRRVGKSTLMRQLIDQLLIDGTPSTHILRYQLDDPFFIAAKDQGVLFEEILKYWEHIIGGEIAASKTPLYCFLDEVQRFPRWELFIKRIIDLKRPVCFVLSGSASTTIFRSSLESLLGRVKDYHLSTFSFPELMKWRKEDLQSTVHGFQAVGDEWLKNHNRESLYKALRGLHSTLLSKQEKDISLFLGNYFMWGGFPQVWELNSITERQEYLLQNHIEKVIREDLILVRNIKKPDHVEKLFLYLINQTGQEIQETRLASECGLSITAVRDYMQLLQETDLLTLVHKFKTKRGLKRSAQKVYAADLALRNASFKYQSVNDLTPIELGRYAETVVYHAIRSWPGNTEVNYYRDRNDEVDFVVNIGSENIPIEVKYRRKPRAHKSLEKFIKKHKCKIFFIITKDELERHGENGISIPLRLFLLLFRTNALR